MNLRKSFQRLVLGPEQQAIPVLGRNDRCWCGSGKKYKACHLSTDDPLTQHEYQHILSI